MDHNGSVVSRVIPAKIFLVEGGRTTETCSSLLRILKELNKRAFYVAFFVREHKSQHSRIEYLKEEQRKITEFLPRVHSFCLLLLLLLL
jgi:hypothetical protein